MNHKMDADLFSERIAALFKSIRLNRGLNQQELSAILGISQSAVSKVEAGQLQPTVIVWLRFCDLFEVPSDLPLRTPLFNQFMTDLKPKSGLKPPASKKKYA